MLVYMRTPQNRMDSNVLYVSAAVRQLRLRLSPMKHLVAHRLKADRVPAAIVMIFFAATLCSRMVHAQQVETSLPLSQRFTINLAAGVPEYIGSAASASNTPQSQWWFENANNSTSYSAPSFVESTDSAATWQQVGLPYDANIPRTFINQTSGGGQGSLTGNENWYRLHFKVDPTYAGQKFLLNLEGTHTGVQVFINGTLLSGVSAVTADAQATHVVGFVPVMVDLTPYITADGATDNVIAIDVSRGDPWFETPGFSGAFRFGQAMAGLFRNVYLYVTNPVHIPINVYSNQKTWGTYVGTVSEVAATEGTATAASAVVEVQTNVLNESTVAQQVTLTTQIVDANGNVVVTAPPVTQSVPPMTPSTFPSGATPMFQQLITVPNPTLWYPNNSIYGTPYMYKVYHIVSVNGVVVDSAQSPLGIRTITWDANFPYFNGHAMYLWGGSGRYDYPALGSSVPDEQEWRDLAQIAAQGGNIWRPGHSTSSEEFVAAADAYGIMIDQPSGDGEGYFNNPTADDTTLKEEVHRDMIIRDRSHPSILDWEEDNGGNNPSLASALATIETTWDNINPREQADRTYLPAYAYLDECDGAGCEAGNKEQFPNNPAFGAEYWDNMGTGRGLAWDYELAFAAPYLNDWTNGRNANAFGMAQWYFADSPGEVSLYAEFQNQPTMVNFVRSLGYSSVDMNRFPRLLYYIYQANWVPYSIQPVVHLAHHWNRAYEYTQGTPLQENAFSNCPAVRLLINGVAKDPVTGAVLADQTPNAWNVDSSVNLTQSTTVMPGEVHWMVNWASGTVTAECLDSSGNVVSGVTDSRTTAGAENKIVLSVVPEVVKPDGTSFQWTSNGSDAAFVQAQVQDANGNIVPTAADNVMFAVSGPATYMGGSQQYVADPSWTTYYQDAFSEANSSVIAGVPYAFFHAPGDPELSFEGGLQKIALRSTFTPGIVTVTASASGLVSGSVQLTSVAPPAPVQSQPPAIIVPPVSTATTAGYSATFTVAASGSGTLSYQWSVNGSQVEGATGTTYTTPATTLAENGESVAVTVTSSFGTVTSTPVTLTVTAAANVAITAQPASQTVVVGQTATLSVTASGSPEINYEWFENGAVVASGSQNSYTTPVLTATGTENFYVIVSNPLGQVQSATAVLTINAATPVSITTAPVGQIVATNQPVQFTAVVAGSAPYTYQWQFTPTGGSSTILVSNTQTSNTITYTIPAMSSSNVGAYTVTVNNAANVPATSAAAQLTLAPPGVNLALDMPATSSSSQDACTDGTTTPPYSGAGCLGAENAVDGNLQTRWASASANAPPTPAVAGVDPSWLQVDLGSVQSFNTVIINWENAYATQYQIQYTSADPTTNPTWNVAYTNGTGVGGTETLNFSTVQGRYIRMYGIQRATQYGYSIYEFQVYNVPQCGGSTERYTISSSNSALVTDNLTSLTWTRTVETDTAAGSQFTGVNAMAYCSSINMRVPAESEALSISGNNNASCALPGAWSTWTSTVDPNDASETAIVNFDGTTSWNVTNNYPGQTLCVEGTSPPQVPSIQTQPASQSVDQGGSVTFSVVAGGTSPLSYQWYKNAVQIPGAVSASYTTPATASTDNGATFYVVVIGPTSETITSGTATLTVLPPPSDVVAIAAGSAGSGTFSADEYFTGGGTGATGNTISLAGVIFPAPEAVYQTERNGVFAYTIPNLVAGDSYPVLLHFAEFYWTAVGQRIFNVSINGTPVLTNFDIIAAAGAANQAIVEQFNAVAGSGGNITISFTSGSADQPKVDGIEVRTSGSTTCAAAPPAPTGVVASGTSISGATVSWNSVTPPAGCSINSYSIYRSTVSGFTPSSSTLITAGVSGTSYGDTGLAANTTYYYLVEAVDAAGASVPSTHASATTLANVVDLLSISSGGAGITGTTWVADEDVSGGSTYTATTTVSTSGVANAAPAAVYQSERSGVFTYTLPGLTAGGAYTIRLHFAEIYFTQAGQRVFNVAMNGTSVLSNFDIVAAAGGPNIALVEQFSATANSNGQIVVSFTNGTANQPKVSGIELLGSATTPTTATSLTATATSPSQINLAWTASATPGVTYNVYGATTQGFTPSATNLIVSGSTGTTYSNTGLIAGTTYFYAVEAVNSTGSSSASSQASATTYSACTGSCASLLAISSGGTGISGTSWLADEDYSGGGTYTTGNTVSTTGVVNAAPEAIYQSERSGAMSYTIPGLTAGSSYTVALHFAEIYWTQAGQRIFNVAINGTTVLSNFDIVATAGGPNIALVEEFAATANSSGQIVVSFIAGSADQPKVSGIQIFGTAGATATAPVIVTQPAAQTVTIGTTATFTVSATGDASLTYQWLKNGTAIAGATGASYITPGTTATDNASTFSVTVTDAEGSTTSNSVALTVNSSPSYTVKTGYLVTDLNNNTRGAWADNQIYVEILGNDPVTGALSWVNYNGTVTAATVADNTATNALTAPNGQTYPNYAFTLAQSKQLVLPPLSSGRIYISEGSPLYMSIEAGANGGDNGYAGPNPLNATDPNININYDWYEFTYSATGGVYINTTQVDEFGLPLLLDVWGSSETFHQQVGINESVFQIDSEFTSQVPSQFQPTTMSNLRILSPTKLSMAVGGTNANYFATYVAGAWSGYTTTPLSITLNGRQFTGTASGTTLTFTEVNPGTANNVDGLG
jgi:beta-galactosidase